MMVPIHSRSFEPSAKFWGAPQPFKMQCIYSLNRCKMLPMQYQHALWVFTWGLDNLVMEKPYDRMLVFGRIPLSIPQAETLTRMQITVTCSDFDAALLKIAGVTECSKVFFDRKLCTHHMWTLWLRIVIHSPKAATSQAATSVAGHLFRFLHGLRVINWRARWCSGTHAIKHLRRQEDAIKVPWFHPS